MDVKTNKSCVIQEIRGGIDCSRSPPNLLKEEPYAHFLLLIKLKKTWT